MEEDEKYKTLYNREEFESEIPRTIEDMYKSDTATRDNILLSKFYDKSTGGYYTRKPEYYEAFQKMVVQLKKEQENGPYESLYSEKEFYDNFPNQYQSELEIKPTTKDGIIYKNLYGQVESGGYRILKIETNRHGKKILTPNSNNFRDFHEFKRVVAFLKEREKKEKEEKEQIEREKEQREKREEKKKTRRRFTRDKPINIQAGSKRKSVRNRKSKTKSKKARKSRKKKGTRTGR